MYVNTHSKAEFDGKVVEAPAQLESTNTNLKSIILDIFSQEFGLGDKASLQGRQFDFVKAEQKNTGGSILFR